MTRKNISKGKRFDIFRRDGFTCQYCGEQPPGIVLHVDHITPVSKGGTNDEMNLVTSCADCNLGKSAKLLDRPQRPDADLAWLETQQEIAELRRYQETLQERRAITADIVNGLQDIWQDQIGEDWAPSGEILRRILAKYDVQLVEAALLSTSIKVAGGYLPSSGNDWVKYLWGTLKTMEREQ